MDATFENLSDDELDKLTNPDTSKINNDIIIYCGPDIPKMGLKKFRSYIPPLPFEIQQAIIQFPVIEKLLATPANLETFRKKIAASGTREHEYYKIVSAII